MKVRCWICKSSSRRFLPGGEREQGAAGDSGKLFPLPFRLLSAFFCLAFVSLLLCACGNASKTVAQTDQKISPEPVAPQPAPAEITTAKKMLAPCWLPLQRRLVADGLPAFAVDEYLSELAPLPTQSPMGRKMLELYRRKFFPAPPKSRQQRYYKGVVTAANAALCRDFIRANQQAFDAAQSRFGVPPAIAASLLFVETRLGKVLGDVPENAFYTLASMAVSTQPDDISEWLPRMQGYENHLAWLDETMRKRADWAYNETRALVAHMIRDKVPPAHLPGSIYGAVGLCQFMPSNISSYGADGDGDGLVDLFTVPDAVASLANYLYKHGWRAGQSREKQHKLLMTYNHSQVYANTILALADLVRAGTTGTRK